MCGSHGTVPAGKKDSQADYTQDTRGSLPVSEYRVPYLEEAYRDDLTRGTAYQEKQCESGTGHF